jgi:multicomponent Na+:H+ antiporter subunit B
MNETIRQTLFWVGAAIVGVFAVTALVELPSFGDYRGPYGDVINRVALPERHTPQSVAAVNFDYRGFDTLGEEFIFLTAVTGILLLMRTQQSEHEEKAADSAKDRHIPPTSDALRALGTVLFGFSLLTGAYIVCHGHLTPGGGFQGGVILVSAFFYIYLSSEYDPFHHLVPGTAIEVLEVVGAGGFVVVGIAGLLSGTAYLQNILPLGRPDSLLSGGTIPVLNVLVGIEVCSGWLLVLSEYLRQAFVIRDGRK